MPESPQQAGLGRRVLALLLDWGVASAISAGFFNHHPLVTVGIFALTTWILVGTLSATIGHVIVGIAVRRMDGGLPGPVKALIRTVALCLVIPAVVWSPADGRAMHDVWSGTVITRIR